MSTLAFTKRSAVPANKTETWGTFRFEPRSRENHLKKAQHRWLCEHFFKRFSREIGQIWKFVDIAGIAAKRFTLFACLLLLLLAACSEQGDKTAKLRLKPVKFSHLPHWQDDDIRQALPAFHYACDVFQKRSANQVIIYGTRVKDWQQACQALKKIPLDNATASRRYFEKWFQPYRVSNGRTNKGLFTGYYIPFLHGSLKPTEKYRYPIYARPNDLVSVENLGIFRPETYFKGRRIAGCVKKGRLVPCYGRKTIEKGALKNRGLELVWVDDPADLFFMQIQGSGVVMLEDGSQLVLGYNGTNGHRYTSIGKILLKRGDITRKDMSMKAIRQWMRDYPKKAKALMGMNRSYVFFRVLPNHDVLGTMGIPLTPMRSIAVDRSFIPMGVPMWLNIKSPDAGHHRIQRLVIAQDTGGAIRGVIRADLFCGFGNEAGRVAGRLHSRGEYYMLLPRKVSG